MQSKDLKTPYLQPTISSNINPRGYDLGNINFNSIGNFGANMNDQIVKLSNLLKTRGKMFIPTVPTPNTPIVTSPKIMKDSDGDGDGDGSIVKYTRQQFEDLYKKNENMNRMGMGGDENAGYFDKLFFMFQLYIAFINALMNAANMSASIIFGNESLQKIFSVFLVNILNMILKTNVADLTPEQLRDLLEKNRPVLQQISNIIIDEASQLLVGLSDICSKIAMDWVQNVLPGLVKSAAVGIPSALEAAIPPLGELVEIINTVMALLASFMHIVGAVQRNVDHVAQGYTNVKSAYDSLQKIKDLLNQSPSDIVKNATSAVVTPAVNGIAQNFIRNQLKIQPQPRPLENSKMQRQSGGSGSGKKMKSRKYLKNPKKFNIYISKLRKKTAKKEMELMKSIQELKHI